mmetsp:Transcript_10451/g.23717  ORF Transcript_10451/g.23717 Transcript_10451/m.23717 type:complete len:1069 (+) Transcript_10451:214-3420(+)
MNFAITEPLTPSAADDCPLPSCVDRDVYEAALQVAFSYASCGVEHDLKGHTLLLGDPERLLNLGDGRSINAFRPPHEVCILQEDGKEVVRRYMNHDGMIVINGKTGRPVMNEFFANRISSVRSGGARTAATLWVAEQVPVVALKISSDSKGEILLLIGSGDGPPMQLKIDGGDLNRQGPTMSLPFGFLYQSPGVSSVDMVSQLRNSGVGLREPLLHRDYTRGEEDLGEEKTVRESGMFYKGRPVMQMSLATIHNAVMQSVADFDGGNAVRKALEARADINAMARYERKNQDVSSEVAFEAIHLAAGLGSVPILDILITYMKDRGCDPVEYVNRPTKLFQASPAEDCQDFYYPLHDALFCGQIEAALFLLKSTADASKQNSNNMTPLHLLAQCGSGWPRQHHLRMIVEELLVCRADLQATVPDTHPNQEERGCTPMDLALKGSSRFPTRYIYLLAPSYWSSAGDPKCIHEVHLCSLYLPKAAEVLAHTINQRASEPVTGVDLQWRIRRQAQMNVEGVIADLLFRAPRAAVDLMDILVVQPVVREPARYPLRSYTAMPAHILPLAGSFGTTALKCTYQPDRVKVSGVWWPEWAKRGVPSNGKFERQAAQWHEDFLPSYTNPPLFEVEVLALLLPNVIHEDIFKALSLVRLEDADVFASLPVRGLIFFLWRCKARPMLGMCSSLLLLQMAILSFRSEVVWVNITCWSLTVAVVFLQLTQLFAGVRLHLQKQDEPSVLQWVRPGISTYGRFGSHSPMYSWRQYMTEFSTASTCVGVLLQVSFLTRSFDFTDGEAAVWEAHLLRVLNLLRLFESLRCWEILHTNLGFAVDMLYLVSAKTALTVVALLFCATAVVAHEAHGDNIAALLWLLGTVISGNDEDQHRDTWRDLQFRGTDVGWVLLSMAIFFHVVVMPAIIASYVFEFTSHAKRRHVLFTRVRAQHCGWIITSTPRLPKCCCGSRQIRAVLGLGCLLLTAACLSPWPQVGEASHFLLVTVAGLLLGAGVVLWQVKMNLREAGGGTSAKSAGEESMRFLWMCQRADLGIELSQEGSEDWEDSRSSMRRAVELSALETVG